MMVLLPDSSIDEGKIGTAVLFYEYSCRQVQQYITKDLYFSKGNWKIWLSDTSNNRYET